MEEIRLPNYDVELVALSESQVVDWGHSYLKASAYYRKSRGAGAIAFVIDTAGEFDHPDLVANTLPQYNRNVTPDPDPDGHGHGHHCAGIIGAADNRFGVIGIAPEVKLVALKALTDSGSGTYAWVADQIRYVADLDLAPEHKGFAKIISLSLGGPAGTPTSKELSDAIKYAISKGVFIVAAAGNWGDSKGDKSSVSPPGNHPDVLTVASSQKPGDVRSAFSSKGPEVELIAPGSVIYSTHKGGAYARLSGTSMACPQVVGIVALIVTSVAEIDTQSKLIEFLTRKATDVLAPGRDDESGWGVPIVPNYMGSEPNPDPKPDPNPDPVPDPPSPPNPDPDPDIPPRRGRGVAAIPYVFPGGSYSFVFKIGSANIPLRPAIVSDLHISSVTNVDAEVMGRILRDYLNAFFDSRGIIAPANFDFYDIAVFAGVFLKLIADDPWVVKRYGVALDLRINSMRVQTGNVSVEISEKEIEARAAAMKIDPPGVVSASM